MTTTKHQKRGEKCGPTYVQLPSPTKGLSQAEKVSRQKPSRKRTSPMLFSRKGMWLISWGKNFFHAFSEKSHVVYCISNIFLQTIQHTVSGSGQSGHFPHLRFSLLASLVVLLQGDRVRPDVVEDFVEEGLFEVSAGRDAAVVGGEAFPRHLSLLLLPAEAAAA